MMRDFRFAVRLLASTPVWSSVAVLSLGLGLGAFIAGASVLRATVLDALPYRDPEQLVLLSETNARTFGNISLPVRDATYFLWRQHQLAFADLLICQTATATLVLDGSPERADIARVSWNTFEMLGVQPMLGRAFARQEDEPGHDDVVIVSHEEWRRRFNSRSDIVDRAVRLDGRIHTIVGVLPSGVRFPEGHELSGFINLPASFRPAYWVPIALRAQPPSTRARNYNYGVIGRLRPGVSSESAQTELERIAQRLAQEYPGAYDGHSARVSSLQAYVTTKSRLTAQLLMLGGLFVLLMSFLNVGSMLLARLLARQNELTLRLAIGASSRQLAKQFFVESLLLTSASALLALLVATLALRTLISLQVQDIPRLDTATINVTMVLATLITAGLLAIMLTGIGLIRLRRADVAGTLRSTGLSPAGSVPIGRYRLVCNTIIVVETSLALVLLVGLLLMASSYHRLMGVPRGFQAESVLTFRLTLDVGALPRPDLWDPYFARLLAAVQAIPTVRSAAMIDNLPLTGDGNISDTSAEGQGSDATVEAEYRRISDDYFETMRIPLLEGRGFHRSDEATSMPVAVVDRAMADALWPERSALGQRFKRGNGPWRTIVGVVAPVKHSGLDKQSRFQVYMPSRQSPWLAMTVVVSADGQPALMNDIRPVIWRENSAQPISHVSTMTTIIERSVARQRLLLRILQGFAITALLLAATGVYGLVSYTVRQQLREMAIRQAIGASSRQIFWRVLTTGLRATTSGVALGLLGAWALSRWLASQLFEVNPADPFLYGAAALGLTCIAGLALFFPARRAARSDPATLFSLR